MLTLFKSIVYGFIFCFYHRNKLPDIEYIENIIPQLYSQTASVIPLPKMYNIEGCLKHAKFWFKNTVYFCSAYNCKWLGVFIAY